MGRKPMGMGLILTGLIFLALGTGIALSEFIFDTTAPNIVGTYPSGSEGQPSPLTLGKTITVELDSDSHDIDNTTVGVIIMPDTTPLRLYPDIAMSHSAPYRYTNTFTISHTDSYTFYFSLSDLGGRESTRVTYGEVGDAQGDFYVKDGNDLEYTFVGKNSTVTFDHLTVYFEFRATDHGADIASVWIEADGNTVTLSEVDTNSRWNGGSWTAPRDGKYTVYGKFSAFGRDFTGMSIIVNQGTPSDELPMLGIFGIGLIVVGFVAMVSGSSVSRKRRR